MSPRREEGEGRRGGSSNSWDGQGGNSSSLSRGRNANGDVKPEIFRFIRAESQLQIDKASGTVEFNYNRGYIEVNKINLSLRSYLYDQRKASQNVS